MGKTGHVNHRKFCLLVGIGYVLPHTFEFTVTFTGYAISHKKLMS